MPEDRVTITADASQYFDVLSRAGVASDRLAGSGERIGAGFIRGDRVIRSATQNITQGLLTANSAADAAIITFQSLERVFRIPIVSTVAIAAGIAGIAALRNEIKKTETALEAARRALKVPLEIQAQFSSADIVVQIEAIDKSTQELDKRLNSVGEKIHRFFAGPLLSTPGALRSEITDQIAANERRSSALSEARANKELEIAHSKLEQLSTDKEGVDLAKAELDLTERRAKLLDEEITKGGNTLNFYKRFLALQTDLEVASRKKAEADKKTLDTAKATTAELEKQAKLAADAATKTSGQQASERRQVRGENRREKELKDQLSREGDPEKRADIRDQLAEIQQAREDRAKQQQEKEAAAQAAAQAAVDARAKQQAIEQQQTRENADRQQKARDRGELLKFGRILSPEERLSENIKAQEEAHQKSFQDQTDKEQQDFRDRGEAEARGISVDQLKRERDFKRGKGEDVSNTGGQDFSSVASLADKDFSSLASLGGTDFSGLASLNGLSITIA